MQKPDISKFKYRQPIQLRWNDLDPLGHVNNALFISYFEIARGTFMIDVCPGWDWNKDMFLIGNIEVSYLKELVLYDRQVEVRMRTEKIGTKSFVLEYIVTSEKDSQTVIHAIGKTTQIMFDLKSRSTHEIPDWVKKGLETQ